jgi:hypothetical protein
MPGWAFPNARKALKFVKFPVRVTTALSVSRSVVAGTVASISTVVLALVSAGRPFDVVASVT